MNGKGELGGWEAGGGRATVEEEEVVVGGGGIWRGGSDERGRRGEE